MAVESVITELQSCPTHGGQQVAAQREASVRNLITLNWSEGDRNTGWFDFVKEDREHTVCVTVSACVHQPAVDMVNECVDDVSEDEGPCSSQAVLHLSEQKVDEQVIHEEDAVTFVAVGRLCCSFTHRQQNPLDRNLRHKKGTTIMTILYRKLLMLINDKTSGSIWMITETSHRSF